MRFIGWNSILFLFLISYCIAYRLGDYSLRPVSISNRINSLTLLSSNIRNNDNKLDIDQSKITARAYYNEQRILHVYDWNKKILTNARLQKENIIETWNSKLVSTPVGLLLSSFPGYDHLLLITVDNETEFTALFREITNLNFGDTAAMGSINDIAPLLDRIEISKQLILRIPLMKNVSNICYILWVMSTAKLTLKG